MLLHSYLALQPTQIAVASFEMVKPGRFSGGTNEIPFEVKLQPLNGKVLYETYHGVYITIQVSLVEFIIFLHLKNNTSLQYMIKVEMKRSVLNRDLMKGIEFVVEVPVS